MLRKLLKIKIKTRDKKQKMLGFWLKINLNCPT
jgi:hypothetical protein